MQRIDVDIFQILQRSTIEGNAVRLPSEQLERVLYQRVAYVLNRMRGKWDRKTQTHQFPYPAAVFAPLWANLLDTGIMPDKNPLDFFPTPVLVIDEMLGEIRTYDFDENNLRILEPSAGCGAIADRLRVRFPQAALTLIEADDVNCAVLRSKNYTPIEGRFEDYTPGRGESFDLVVMNPPFALKNDPQAYITHIRHAFGMLNKGGQLITIAPNGFTFRSDTRSLDFLHWVNLYGDFCMLPEKSFAESGTNAPTVLINLKNQDITWRSLPVDGFNSFDTKALAMYASNDADFLGFVQRNKRAARTRWITELTNFAHETASHSQEGFIFNNIDFDELIAYFIDDPVELSMQAVSDLPLFAGGAVIGSD